METGQLMPEDFSFHISDQNEQSLKLFCIDRFVLEELDESIQKASSALQ